MRKCLFVVYVWGILFSVLLASAGAEYIEQRYSIPEPKYKIRVERSVWVLMRDGVRLSTDLYFPEEAGEKLPVVLIRTPYNKDFLYKGQWIGSYLFAGQGYVVAVQDVRGRYASEGEFTVLANDAKDGYDTVTWLATQPWSNGNIGTYGCSYLGGVQIAMAKLRNPHLKAMIPQSGGGRKYYGLSKGGVFELSTSFGWFISQGTKIFFRPPPGTPREVVQKISKFFNPAPLIPEIDFRTLWNTLPVIDMVKKAGVPPTDFEDFLSHESSDPWWDQFGLITDSDHFDVPALHINSWHDLYLGDTLYFFNLFQRNAESDRCRNNQFAIISPMTHCASEFGGRARERTIVGARDMGDTRFDFWGAYIRWFDYWLKGIENGVTNMPKFQFYVMGKNEWRGEKRWPLARTQFTKYFLHSDGHANSRFGTGTLSVKKPGNEAPDRFVYDPKTPVPSLGGPICCTGTPDAQPGAFDQAEVEMRNDVLVYTSPVLGEGIEITGPIQAVLYVSSSVRDTDFTAKLVDVYPDGRAFNVQEGILRARYREGFDRKVFMKSGEVYEVKIDLLGTSNYFGPGHRIRVEISKCSSQR